MDEKRFSLIIPRENQCIVTLEEQYEDFLSIHDTFYCFEMIGVEEQKDK